MSWKFIIELLSCVLNYSITNNLILIYFTDKPCDADDSEKGSLANDQQLQSRKSNFIKL